MIALILNNLKCLLSKNTIKIYILISIVSNIIYLIYLYEIGHLENSSTGFDYSILSTSTLFIKNIFTFIIIQIIFIIFLVRYLVISYKEISSMDNINYIRVSCKKNNMAKIISLFIMSLLIITIVFGINLFFLEIYTLNQDINIHITSDRFGSSSFNSYYIGYSECELLLTSSWLYSLIHFVCYALSVSSFAMIVVAISKYVNRIFIVLMLSLMIVGGLYILYLFLQMPNLSSIDRFMFFNSSHFDGFDCFNNIYINTVINSTIYILISVIISKIDTHIK